ncbi:MAG: hypothetical protein M1538_03500 [Candidatus Marsarchaeota archaeon]|nr:hypothetical protein [Candidatus Marsarchaeota archaeon]
MERKTKISKHVVKERENKIIEDLLLLAFIFIGLGIGIAYLQVAAGLLIGFGVGMIFREFLRPKKDKLQEIAISMNVAAYILVLIGVYFIIMGIVLLENFTFFYPYNASYILVIIGIIFIALYAIERKNKK